MPESVNFASDNVGGAAPEILDAIAKASSGAAMPYGADPWTTRFEEIASEVFETTVRAFPVATGSAANALALSVLTPPYGAIYCHEKAHIEEDECCAPEFYAGGAKLSLLPGDDAKISFDALRAKLEGRGPGSAVHHAVPSAVSLTQATELGAVYSVEEVSALAELAHAHGLPVHMDGARIANAIASLGVSPAEATWKAGVDVLSLGATKNGAFTAEAVVFFDPEKAADFEFRRKRGGHLFSKMRLLSCQLCAYLEDGNWLSWAGNANARAADLANGLKSVPGVSLWGEVPANMMFLDLPGGVLAALKEAGCTFYTWGERPDGSVSARLVTRFDTSEADVAHFLAAARQGAAQAAE